MVNPAVAPHGDFQAAIGDAFPPALVISSGQGPMQSSNAGGFRVHGKVLG